MIRWLFSGLVTGSFPVCAWFAFWTALRASEGSYGWASIFGVLLVLNLYSRNYQKRRA